MDRAIERSVRTLYSAGRDAKVLTAIEKRGYRREGRHGFLKYPRQEDNLEMLVASWELDVDAAYRAVTCPLALVLATGGDVDENRLTRRRESAGAFARASAEVEMVEFPCGHDVLGFLPDELAHYISDWAHRICG